MLRFCCSNVLAYGQTFLDLVLHTSTYIKTHMQVVYSTPDSSWKRHASSIMQRTHLDKSNQAEAATDSELTSTKAARLDLFLEIFNSNWKHTGTQDLKHHCRVGCPCKCVSRTELADLASSLYVELILFGRPPIPALNRWLRCRETAKWYLTPVPILVGWLYS